VGLFKKDRKPEDQAGGSGIESFEDGKVPWAADRESIGQPVQGAGPAAPGFDLASLGGMGAVLQQMQQAQGGITIDLSQGQQSIDASNTELGEQMKEVMRKYGIDPETGASGNVDPSQMLAMQQEMMQLMSGNHPSQTGARAGEASSPETPKFNIQMSEPTDPDGSGS